MNGGKNQLALDIDASLQLTRSLSDTSLAAAWVMLGVFALLAFYLGSFRAVLLGDSRGPMQALASAFCCVVLLTCFHDLFDLSVAAATELASALQARADWDAYWVSRAEDLQALGSDDHVWSRLLGWSKNTFLMLGVSISYFFAFLVFRLMLLLTAFVLNFLQVVGPFLLAGGVVTQGATVTSFFSTLLQTLLWPSVPPLMMIIISQSSAQAGATDNIAYLVGQNLCLGLLTLLTPAVVALLLGEGGVATLGRAGTSAVLSCAPGAMRAVAPRLGGALGRVSGAFSYARAAQGRGGAGQAARRDDSPTFQSAPSHQAAGVPSPSRAARASAPPSPDGSPPAPRHDGPPGTRP